MNNIILITSDDKIVLDEKLHELTKKDKNIEIVHYDLLETNIGRLVEDLDTYNFLTNKRL